MLRTALALAACLACAHAADFPAPAPAPGPPQIAGLSVVDTYTPSNCSRMAKIGDVATIHYTGTLANGTQFDTSIGRQPFSFEVGKHQVLPGVEYGVIGMCAGEKRNLTMAPELGYGTKGSPPAVPGNAKLKFAVNMLNVTDPVAPAPNPLAPLAPLVTSFLQQGLNSILNGK